MLNFIEKNEADLLAFSAMSKNAGSRADYVQGGGGNTSVKLADGTYRAYSQNGEFLMLAKVENGIMSTVKSFFEV